MSDFMLSVRAIGCIGINGYYSNRCVAVLSIDSLDENPFDSDKQLQIAGIARLLAQILES
jgi:putative methionine-R-sulfoxide reductase with GAF domain